MEAFTCDFSQVSHWRAWLLLQYFRYLKMLLCATLCFFFVFVKSIFDIKLQQHINHKCQHEKEMHSWWVCSIVHFQLIQDIYFTIKNGHITNTIRKISGTAETLSISEVKDILKGEKNILFISTLKVNGLKLFFHTIPNTVWCFL